MDPPALVIFDCDGVLVDSESISASALSAALKELGLAVSPQAVRQSYLGPRMSEIAERIETQLGRALPPDWLMQFEARRAETFRRELRPMRGAEQAIERIAAAQIAVCVASQAGREITRLKLEATGLARFFPGAAVFSAAQVQLGKPSPDLFLHAAISMGFSPQQCVVVEDTARGVLAARSAQMRALGVAADGDQAGLLGAGAEILPSLAALPDLLRIA